MDFEGMKRESARLRGEMRERTAGYMVTALGIVAGLVWNEAIKALIDFIYPAGGGINMSKIRLCGSYYGGYCGGQQLSHTAHTREKQ